MFFRGFVVSVAAQVPYSILSEMKKGLSLVNYDNYTPFSPYIGLIPLILTLATEIASIIYVALIYAIKVVKASRMSEKTGPRSTKPYGYVNGPVASNKLMIVAEPYNGVIYTFSF